MKDKLINNKSKLIILCTLLIILIFSYVIFVLFKYNDVRKYDNKVLPNTYLGEFNLSDYSYDNVIKNIDYYNDYVLGKKVKFVENKREFIYTLKDIGVSINKEKTLNSIKDYQNKLSFSKKLKVLNKSKNNKIFYYVMDIDDKKMDNFLKMLSTKTDVNVLNGYFDTSNGVKYTVGHDGFKMNVSLSKKELLDCFDGSYDKKELVVNLKGDTVKSKSDPKLATIDTMTSSFVTSYNEWEGTRPINLKTALNYINGAIIQPGEVFSYYKYAGPFDKTGYVFYYEFVGNGVCQIATTTYNAALLGGLEIVKRYPHAKKSVYVPGGLDATVASYSSGWYVDMQFKNTYKYPIYVKAYSTFGEAHVEFWSNKNAKEGKTYKTESVWLGGRGYKSFLHTYKDGKEISNNLIDTTWYIEG